MRIGLVGGTFDPVHLGHLALGEEARVQLELDRVLFLPAGQPWMKAGEQLSPARHRVEMLELAVSSNPYFQVCLEEINRPGLTYTVDTLDALVEKLGGRGNAVFHSWPGRYARVSPLERAGPDLRAVSVGGGGTGGAPGL